MKCPNCGHEIERFEGKCPDCGKPLTRGKRKKKKSKLIAATVAAIFLLTGGAFTALYLNDEETVEQPVQPDKPAVQNTEEEPPEEEPVVVAPDEEEEQPDEGQAEGTVQREISETSDTMTEAIILPEKIAGQERDAQTVIKESLPKVFTVITDESIGSGFLYKEGGLVVTNAHVVAGFTRVTVRNGDGKESEGRVIGISDRSDVALIKVEDYANAVPFSPETGVTPIGTEVIAIGSPNGLANTVTTGKLTGHNKNMEIGFLYENIYQMNARIDRGSSGGPLIDAKTGKVVGINSLVMQDDNLVGFAIPLFSMTGLLDKWAASPMSADQVAALFGSYDNYEGGSATPEDDHFEGGWEGDSFNEIALENFILSFGHFHVLMMTDADFFFVADLVQPGSPAYGKLEEEVAGLGGKGVKYELTDQEVSSVDILDDHAVVHALESTRITADDGTVTEKSLAVDYTVVIDENGFFQVSDRTVTER
ncbi:trypsin-like peptidase domain-containing protein [Bhargavaea ullalensis]|uniref:S1-C subfamily serine protease n=2 Tax=Bhargavaea ullalensis TaxID=1265685 RepID=A0ABV2GDK2_9BACL